MRPGPCAVGPAVLGGRGRSSGAGGSGPRILASPEHPGCPMSPMRPIGAGVRGARSIYRRVGCPNLLQRPRSGRSAGGESLVFRAFLRGRSGRGAPLQQIWTNPRPRPSQEPHPHHRDPLNPCSRRRRSRRCTAAAISPGLRGAEARKAHPHSSLHSHYYQQYRHWRTVALYCHGPVARQGVRSCEKVAPAYF